MIQRVSRETTSLQDWEKWLFFIVVCSSVNHINPMCFLKLQTLWINHLHTRNEKTVCQLMVGARKFLYLSYMFTEEEPTPTCINTCLHPAQVLMPPAKVTITWLRDLCLSLPNSDAWQNTESNCVIFRESMPIRIPKFLFLEKCQMFCSLDTCNEMSFWKFSVVNYLKHNFGKWRLWCSILKPILLYIHWLQNDDIELGWKIVTIVKHVNMYHLIEIHFYQFNLTPDMILLISNSILCF